MAFLGLDFIISSLIWLSVILLLVFTFRKHIFKKYYPQVTFDLFINKLKIFLEKKYPKITFDLSILDKTKEIKNPDERTYSIIDDIINQYKNISLDTTKFTKPTPQELQWSSYIFNSEPNKNKLPKDWMQRKNALLTRDHKECLRCSTSVDINSVHIYMIRSLEKGGTYHLENLIPVCGDCEIILTNNTKKIAHLKLKEELDILASESF